MHFRREYKTRRRRRDASFAAFAMQDADDSRCVEIGRPDANRLVAVLNDRIILAEPSALNDQGFGVQRASLTKEDVSEVFGRLADRLADYLKRRPVTVPLHFVTNRRRLMFTAGTHQDRYIVHFRVHYKDYNSDDGFRPGKEGITFNRSSFSRAVRLMLPAYELVALPKDEALRRGLTDDMETFLSHFRRPEDDAADTLEISEYGRHLRERSRDPDCPPDLRDFYRDHFKEALTAIVGRVIARRLEVQEETERGESFYTI